MYVRGTYTLDLLVHVFKKVITSHNDCRDDRENLITMKTSYPVHCCFIGRYVFCKDVHVYFFRVIRVHIQHLRL